MTSEDSEARFASIACLTHAGRVRPGNEDAFVVIDLTEAESTGTNGELPRRQIGRHGLLLAVADAVGGARAGEVASRMAVEHLACYLVTSPKTRPVSVWLNEGLKSADREIRRASKSNPEYEGMGAAITAAVVHDEQAIIGQVGGSRAYLIRGGRIVQLTKDQSPVQAVPDVGRLTEEGAARFPYRNVILRALGSGEWVEPDMCFVVIERGDHLLLCTDGLHNKVNDVEMLDAVREAELPGEACGRLVALANERGGENNITLVVARFDGAGWPPPEQTAGREVKVGRL